MANEISTVQSLKAVDAWIDVINANINGGVRTAYKTSRLKFSGNNANVARAGNGTSLPLQFPEPGLTTANTVIDFTQGAITASSEVTHLALQGDGFFMIASPDMVNTANSRTQASPNGKLLLTRDGEFRTHASGFLVNSFGYFLMGVHLVTVGGKDVPNFSTATAATGSIRAIYNDIENPAGWALPAIKLSDFIANDPVLYSGSPQIAAIIRVTGGMQNLQYSQFGSTTFDFGFNVTAAASSTQINPAITLQAIRANVTTTLNKSLEASNASMTQSVPELSLAQKLFSALTKVLQISQTNTDAVLNLVR